MRENAKRISIDVLVDIIGGILLTIATYSFAVPADFPMTGVSGVALIFYQAFGLPVGGTLEYADEVTLYKALENRTAM